MEEKFLSLSEAARLMGISRVAVFKKIKKGEIKARKVGRVYIINRKSIGGVFQEQTVQQKNEIKKAVGRVIKEYGEALKKLGQE